MRPLVVLGLVIVAGATLLFALSSLGSDSRPEDLAVGTEAIERPAPTQAPGPTTLGRVDPGDSAAGRSVSPARTERESLGGDTQSFDGALAGLVTGPDGAPVEGARMTLIYTGSTIQMSELARVLGTAVDEEQPTRATSTNSDGRYRFGSLEPGNYSLVTRHPEFSRREDPIHVDENGEIPWDVQLEEGLVVHGHVRDDKGTPLARVTVELGAFNLPALFAQGVRRRPADPGETVTTDAEGYYRFVNVTPGQWNLTAIAKGYGRETKRNLNVKAKDKAPTEVDFDLAPGAAISGRVFAPDRSGIPGATVMVIGYQQPQTQLAEATADANGNFEIPDLVEGKYVLMANAEGWGGERVNHVEAPSTGVDVEMTEQGSVMGVVVASAGEAPVTSFTASLHQYVPTNGSYGRAMQEKTFESADGAFSLTGVPEGRYGIQVHAPGFASSYSEDFEVTQGLATTDIVVRLGQGGSVVGQIVDQGTGKPVPGATIETRDNNYQDNPIMRMFGSAMPRKTSARKARSDKDGRFEIELLTPELYQLHVTHPSFPDVALNNIRIVEGSPTDVGIVRLVPGGTVRGTVFDKAGNALAGATVQLMSAQAELMQHFEARTGRDGRYVLPNVPAGSYKLTATRPSTNEDPFIQIVDMKNSEVQISVARGQEYPQDLYLGR